MDSLTVTAEPPSKVPTAPSAHPHRGTLLLTRLLQLRHRDLLNHLLRSFPEVHTFEFTQIPVDFKVEAVMKHLKSLSIDIQHEHGEFDIDQLVPFEHQLTSLDTSMYSNDNMVPEDIQNLGN